MTRAAYGCYDGQLAGYGESFAFPLKGGPNAPVDARRTLLARALYTEIREWPGRVRAEVTDPSTGTTSFGARSDGDGKGGWGLFLVDQIADRWGVQLTATGTRVRFEIAV